MSLPSTPRHAASQAGHGRVSRAPQARPVWLIHHAANRGAVFPPGCLEGLRHCLRQDARLIELDITPLSGGGFALLHGPGLERDTIGSGPVGALTAAQVTQLYHVWQGQVTDVPVGLLTQALDLITNHPRPVELQLDLKPHSPLTDSVLSELVEALRPVKDRVRVTSVADWGLRRLRNLDPELRLGFDPLLYLEVAGRKDPDPSVPPFRKGAYGYWDDHPLASRKWGEAADYLRARAEALFAQAPSGGIWYIAAPLLAQAQDDGFDWIAYLHGRGAEVDAWTLDADRPQHVGLARQLASLGIDRITTNDAPALARALSVPVVV